MFKSESQYRFGDHGPQIRTVTVVRQYLGGHPLPWHTQLDHFGRPEGIYDAKGKVVFEGEVPDALAELVRVTNALAEGSVEQIVQFVQRRGRRTPLAG